MSADPSNTVTQDQLSSNSDFATLRQNVISFLQNHSVPQWTDYNYHDPGVTILEQFCFAFTDLAYRTGFDMADLLEKADGTRSDAFPGSLRLLNSFPVIRNDIRKVILDSLVYGDESISDKIYNAWLTEYNRKSKTATGGDVTTDGNNAVNAAGTTDNFSRNLYKVEVQLTTKDYNKLLDSSGEFIESKKKELEKNIAHSLAPYRNICTDYGQIKILYKDEIAITGQVNIKNGYMPEHVLSSINAQIDEFINPHVPFYTLSEMQAKGIAVDEIYEGPALIRGFIRDDDLKLRITEIDVSDISNIIFKTDGVSMVSNIRVNGEPNKYKIGAKLKKPEGDCYPLLITDLRQGQACFPELSKNGARITLSTLNDLQYNTFLAGFNSRRAKPAAGNISQRNMGQNGSFRDLCKYYSIQKYFPAVYGIGDYGLPDKVFVNESVEGTAVSVTARQAQAKQLKAYLVLFEQLLANYLAQLANFGELLTVKFDANSKPITSCSAIQTYFSQAIIDRIYNSQNFNVPNGAAILTDFDQYNCSRTINTEDAETRVNRKGDFLDHLLARVNEKIDSYPYRLYEYLYPNNENPTAGDNRQSCKDEDTGAYAEANKKLNILNKKIEFLENYNTIGYNRSRGFNYYANLKDEAYVSGLEQKIALLLGIDNFEKRELHRITDFSIHDPAPRPKKEEVIDIDIELTKEFVTNTETIIIDYQLNEEIRIEEKDENANRGFHFNNIDSAEINTFFRTGMNLSSYRIGHHKNKNNKHEYFITFFNITGGSDKPRWLRIHTHTQKEVATRKLEEVIELAVNMNRRSEGFHLVEHVLLRDAKNPYKLSIILPLWPARFQDNGFQQYVQQLFTKHAPLYAALNFIWLDLIYMKEFEEYYFPWLASLRNGSSKTNNPDADKLKSFIKEYSKPSKKN